ncbi:MAG: hypothetical protein LRZ98_00980 [Candidatus Pacebacteria bacterium]|nr:hypothetical protein [Candidatus Paceibacterota bacterium]
MSNINKHKILLENLIKIALKEDASDLHISEGRYPTIRVDGILIPIKTETLYQKEDLEEILRIFLEPQNVDIFKKEKEFDFS